MVLRHGICVAILCLGCLGITSVVGTRLLSSMAEALQTHEVIPDVVKTVPASVLNVTYPNNIIVQIGKELTPTQVKDQPNVQWEADSNAFYTLCMTDPDAPSRADPKNREWHHWLVGNIPGSSVSKGDVLSEYVGSGPPKDSGLHRYVFLLYQQPGKLTFDEKRLTNRSGNNRAKFSISKFAEKYKLGDPIAGNMYQAEYDDYVPILYKQLSGILLCVINFSLGDVESEFKKAKIEPDIIDKAPIEKIEVKYGKKVVDFGTELTPTEAHEIPEIHYKHEGGVLYTLVMTDPDAPRRGGYNREFRHWLVGNIPEENIAKGEILAEYVGPAPPKNTGKHRYVFLIYKQNQGAITFDERRLSTWDGSQRKRFSIKKFAEKYNLEGPIAGNFMVAEYDDNVPAYHKRLNL
ncbi:Phosphatidylethanolamine-binding protein like protein F40A3.3 [Trachymyrmex cornetzi]|uniref:Phosphatidylethanolamine-binding protein like protein F40A3.3 n=5 Tax=Attini TaxID=143999 RepID=A0A195E421_9HYME|nr:Phosphatidylethanolamine-binding protein like protein F40A3.3 [Trachymyrmex cornetzi]